MDKNRFLSTAYSELDKKCKHYTRLMFLIHEMLVVMAVKDNKFYALYSSSPQAQRIAVERNKASKGNFLLLLKSLSNPNKNKQCFQNCSKEIC